MSQRKYVELSPLFCLRLRRRVLIFDFFFFCLFVLFQSFSSVHPWNVKNAKKLWFPFCLALLLRVVTWQREVCLHFLKTNNEFFVLQRKICEKLETTLFYIIRKTRIKKKKKKFCEFKFSFSSWRIMTTKILFLLLHLWASFIWKAIMNLAKKLDRFQNWTLF